MNGNLAIGSNASNPTLNIGLSGTGATPGAISATPASLSFGSVQTGSSNSLPETITNSGSSSVTISQVASSSASYSVSGIAPPVTLNAGQNYTFNVTFAPTTSGSSSGTALSQFQCLKPVTFHTAQWEWHDARISGSESI